ncbi:unnamed protein product [Ectocarpus fasciculatus]
MKLKEGYSFLLAPAVFPAAQLVFAKPTGGGLPPAVRHGFSRFAEEDIADAGVGDVHPISEDDQQVGEDLVDVLEADDQTTVVGDIELGELLCDSLEDAPGSSLLRFTISSNETVIAERTAYSSVDGSVLPDGNTRKTWLGDVVDPEPPVDSVPRTVSMTWTNPCDPETFLLKLVSHNSDGGTCIVTSMPCEAGSSNEICMMELEVFFNDESETEPEAPPGTSTPAVEEGVDDGSNEQESRMLKEQRRATPERRMGPLGAQGLPSARSLQETTVIDLMTLYTPEAASQRGITDTQLLTRIVEGMVTLNQAITNSEIANLEFRLVHVEELPYDQMDYSESGSVDVLLPELVEFGTNIAVADLRNQYQADLVQMVGYFPITVCGYGYIFNGNDTVGFSLVNSNCFDNFSHTHEIGHNMGCRHNRENAGADTEYSHGWQYCTDTDTYRTIMATSPNGCTGVPRVNYFSNPDVDFAGKPTGTTTADNARCIEDSMEAVAAFRTNDIVCTDYGETCTTTTDCCTGVCGSAGVCGPYLDPSYLGCFSDPAENRIFESMSSTSAMTAEACSALCSESDFYGTQYSTECWCGDINAPYSVNGEGTCDMACSGNAEEICGGFYSMDVYAKDPSYLGCFSDPADGRIFERGASSDDMTAEACATLCADSSYYGTQYSQECWCGDNDDYDANGFGVCDTSCSGNSDETCGGTYAMSVYQTT